MLLALILTTLLSLVFGGVLVVFLSRRSRFFKKLINHRALFDAPKYLQAFRIYAARVKRLRKAAVRLMNAGYGGWHYSEYPEGVARLRALQERRAILHVRRAARSR